MWAGLVWLLKQAETGQERTTKGQEITKKCFQTGDSDTCSTDQSGDGASGARSRDEFPAVQNSFS